LTKKKDRRKKSELNQAKTEITPDQKTEEASVSEAEVKEELSLEKKLKEAERLLEERQDRFLRLAAEFDNYKKRVSREFASVIRGANQDLISQLLQILDDFDRALESAKTLDDFESFHKGMEMIDSNLQNLLARHGLEPIEAKGERFDPELHEAVMQMASEEVEEGAILEEVNKGYKLNGKVIRHSRVVVSKGKEKQPTVASESSETPELQSQEPAEGD
jgi:molecular chaperone GrpE